jgi:hypothetical protein
MSTKKTVSLEIVTRNLETGQSKHGYELQCLQHSLGKHEIPIIIKKAYSVLQDECKEIAAQYDLISTTSKFIVYYSSHKDLFVSKDCSLLTQSRLLWAEKCNLEIEYRFLKCGPPLPSREPVPPLPLGAYFQACDLASKKRDSVATSETLVEETHHRVLAGLTPRTLSTASMGSTPRLESMPSNVSPRNLLRSTSTPRSGLTSLRSSPRRHRAKTFIDERISENGTSASPRPYLRRTKTLSSIPQPHDKDKDIFVE